jgi:Flp pilus assembly protein CpaB
MELASKQHATELAHKLLSTRRGSTAVGIAAAVLAGMILLVYLNRYRSSLNEGAQPITVLIAKSVIQKGTPGDVIASEGLFQTTTVPKKELKEGALTDASVLRGRVALHDVYPDVQLTTADFSAIATDAVSNNLARDQRAISVPLDSAHGLVGQLQSGDHVDVFAGFNVGRGTAGTTPVIKLIVPNALVLRAPDQARGVAGTSTSNVVLRAEYQQAAEIAFAVDNGKLWVVLRPHADTRPAKPALVTAESLLLGVKPVVAYQRVRTLVGGRP